MSDPTTELAKMVSENAVRVDVGALDSIDVGFFGIKLAEGSDLTALRLKNAIERAQDGENGISMSLSDFLPSEEAPGPSYTRVGAWIGDQGLALALMGLGELLDLWTVVTPRDVGVTSDDLFQRMIGMGFVTIAVPEDSLIARKAAEQ